MDIPKIIDAAVIELYKYFSNTPNIVWKEEDLQSYLYHQILIQEPKLNKKLHREFPIIISNSPREWKGMLDLAITNENSSNFLLENAKIDCAIELKFVRDYRTGLSPKSLKKFETECQKDCDKLLTKAINFNKETKKYFFAFRLAKFPQIEQVKIIFDNIKWDGIKHHYIECYEDCSKCVKI